MGDILEMAKHVAHDEQATREELIRYNDELEDKTMKSAKKELQNKRKRIEELSRMMQAAYEDKVKGKIPEDICIAL